MRAGLPQGAVEIGTIAETEPEEESEQVDPGKETEQRKPVTSTEEEEAEEGEDKDEGGGRKKKKKGAGEGEVGGASGRPFVGPFHLVDDSMPDVMIKVHEKLATPPPTAADCAEASEVNWDAFTSTWLSVSAKGVDIRESVVHLMEPLTAGQPRRPYCEEVDPGLATLDHLSGVKHRGHLHLASEAGLTEAFQVKHCVLFFLKKRFQILTTVQIKISLFRPNLLGQVPNVQFHTQKAIEVLSHFQGLTGEAGVSVDEMATRIANSMDRNSTSWVLSTAAALYWRVRGNAEQAVNCLRHSLRYAPRDMKVG